MRSLLIVAVIFSLSSCWIKDTHSSGSYYRNRVWGNRPVFGATVDAKQISYSNTALPVIIPGNIYAKGNLIYQLEIGKGIHVIDNSIPAQAHRMGFITVNGSSQISIKGNYLYTNSYDDLLVIDISNSNSVTEVKRVIGAFPAGRYNYYYVEPIESGYYQCPGYNSDSVVIGWRKDSIWSGCYKN